MLDEVLDYLAPAAGKKFIDCTLGGAGYTLALAKAVGPTGKTIAFDLDALAIKSAQESLDQQHLSQVELIQANFADLQIEISERYPQEKFDGVVFDLGLSSAQLDDKARGFSFVGDSPLDMSFSGSNQSTIKLINKAKQAELEKIIKDFGEERYYRSIAKSIVEFRRHQPLATTGQLVEAIARAVPAAYRHDRRLNFATRTFQSIRIATNDELVSLEAALPQALALLKPGGRLVVVSFHSLEDRLVKQFFGVQAKDCVCPPQNFICACGHQAELKILTKKPITATADEIAHNPRSSSAKLRAAEKVKSL